MRLTSLRSILPITLLTILLNVSLCAAGNEGAVTFAMRTGTWFDQYTDNPSSSTQAWLRDHFWRMQSTSSYFDSRLSWFPNAWVYLDLYGVPTDSPLVGQHPDWFLRDNSGHLLYIPFACNGSKCSQYAADPGNAGFRSYWISQTSAILRRGYKGVWIDDVNLAFRVGNGGGTQIAPHDPRTGTTMTVTAWMKYVADFTKDIRASLPNTEIVHNSIWFAGESQRDYNPSVIEEIQSADYIDCERGVSDGGLTGGTGIWSLNALLAFVDHVHTLGKKTIFDEYKRNGEYGLAGYFLISTGGDAEADQSMTPNNWWSGYEVNLGTAQGGRYTWNRLLRRDFTGGMVLLNPPQSGTVTVSLPHSFERIGGSSVSSVSLGAGQGAVLLDSTNSQSLQPVRIDVGGSGSGFFSGDHYANAGSVASFSQPVTVSGVAGAAPEAVYQTKRTNGGSAFYYTIPALESGHTYTVKLHFADDLSNARGQRVFNVFLNGREVLANFDIFASAGNVKLKAVVEQFSQVPDANNEIVIEFAPTGKGAALSSGIEIVP